MGWSCEYCKKELNKADPFILQGQYPGFLDRMSGRNVMYYKDDLGKYGKIYHEECFCQSACPHHQSIDWWLARLTSLASVGTPSDLVSD